MPSKPNIKDVNGLETVLDTKLEAISKDMVEDVLTGEIDSHQHDYATSSQGNKADTAIQGISVNNTELASDDNKKVNITVPTTVSELSDSNEYAHLSNGKILEGNLPDYIFGQVLFGGFVAINTSINKLVCTLSAKFKSKYNITDNTLILGNMPASTYEGVYFIATNDFMTSIDVKIGDWMISNGSTWSKVDNSDAVMSVNGKTGAVVLTHTDVGAASSNHTHDYYGKRTVGNDGQIVRDISDPAILALMAESGEIDGTFSIEGYVDDLPIRGGCGDEMIHTPNDWWRGSFVKTFRNFNEDGNTTHFFQMILGSKWLNSTSADPSIYIRAFNEYMYDNEGGNENYSGWSHWRKVLTCKDLANPEFTQLNKDYELDNPYITAGSITNIDINNGDKITYQFALPQMTTDPSEAEATPPKFLSYGESTININLEAGATFSDVWTLPYGYIIINEVDNATKLNMLNNNNSNGAVFVMKIKGFPAVGNKPPYYLLKFELYLQ